MARVLIIEDNPTNLQLMVYLLKAFGHDPVEARDGETGLERARDRPDLILCDIHLPGIDGCEVARHLKSHPELRSVPLVAVTALAMVGDRERVLAAGFDGYVSKPIDPEGFVEQVERFLRSGSAGAAPERKRDHAPATTAKEPGGGVGTVLVVDNLLVNLELARSILEPCGYRVLTARGMAEGLETARGTPCDLILSDVCMDGSNGFDFLTAVRADPHLDRVPFVLLTSTAVGALDQDHGLALGADRFLVRPIEPEALLAELEACLQERQGD